MSTDTQTVVKNSFPLVGLLTTIFVLAKVFGVAPIATWSWVWVLSPLWIGWAIALGILAVAGLFLLLVFLISLIVSK